MRRQKLCLLLSLLCFLTGCTGAQAGEARPAAKDLAIVTSAGKWETISATLWQEDAFSMYLPAEGWTQDAEGVWTPEDSVAALFVSSYELADEEAVWEAVAADYTDYGFLPLEEGTFVGYDGVQSMTMWVRLVEGADAWYAVCAQYPTAEADRLGNCLRQLAGTFRLES